MNKQVLTSHPSVGNSVSIRALNFAYSKHQDPVLSINNWSVKEKDKVFIYGPSGSGKTTLLNLLAGMIVPSSGSIEVFGQSYDQLSGAQRDRFRAQNIGMIFQQFNLIPWLSVLDNVAAAHYFSKSKNENHTNVENRAAELCRRLGLDSSILRKKTSQLSVGQQQRVAVVRALINKPRLVIADEPTSALDAELRDQFMKLLLECVNEHSATLIFVSHDRGLANHFDHQLDLRNLNSEFKDIVDAT